MKKRFFTILLIAIFIIASVGFISAADTSNDGDETTKTILVKIDWKDKGQTSDRPDSVTVNLMKDGKVVDTKTLNESNSWSATFEVEDDGSYTVKQTTELSQYSVSTNGSETEGFVITNTLKKSALSSSNSDDTLNDENNSNDEKVDTTTDESAKGDNTTTDETTNGNTNSSNTTSSTEGNVSENSTNNTQKDVKNNSKPQKHDPPKNEKENPLLKTGLPIIVLIIAVLAVLIIVFTRKK